MGLLVRKLRFDGFLQQHLVEYWVYLFPPSWQLEAVCTCPDFLDDFKWAILFVFKLSGWSRCLDISPIEVNLLADVVLDSLSCCSVVVSFYILGRSLQILSCFITDALDLLCEVFSHAIC